MVHVYHANMMEMSKRESMPHVVNINDLPDGWLDYQINTTLTPVVTSHNGFTFMHIPGNDGK